MTGTKIELLESAEGKPWQILRVNGAVVYAEEGVDKMTWLDLLSDLGCEVSLRKIGEQDMKEGKY